MLATKAGKAFFEEDSRNRTNLGTGEALVGLADPVESEDEQHCPRERAAGPQDRPPPPPREPGPAPVRGGEQRAHAADEVVEQEHERPRDEAEREEHGGREREPRRLRRRQRAAAHDPVRVPARVRRVPGVQLLRRLPARRRGGRGCRVGGERAHGVGPRRRRAGGVEGHCASPGARAERRAGSARRDGGGVAGAGVGGGSASVTRTLSGRRWPLGSGVGRGRSEAAAGARGIWIGRRWARPWRVGSVGRRWRCRGQAAVRRCGVN